MDSSGFPEPVPAFHIIVQNRLIRNQPAIMWENLQHEVSHYGGLKDHPPPPTADSMGNCGDRDIPEEERLEREEKGDGGGGGGINPPPPPDDMNWDEWLCRNFGIRCSGDDDDSEEEEPEEPVVKATLGEIEVVCVKLRKGHTRPTGRSARKTEPN